MAGLIGVTIGIVIDYIGIKLNLYNYPKGILYIGGIPFFNILGIYAKSILYVYWLPRQWEDRLLYTVCISVFYLAVEAAVYSLGGIAYPNWRLGYSYFLLVAGLTLLAVFYSITTCLSEVIIKRS